jgi:hypothetical protein
MRDVLESAQVELREDKIEMVGARMIKLTEIACNLK